MTLFLPQKKASSRVINYGAHILYFTNTPLYYYHKNPNLLPVHKPLLHTIRLQKKNVQFSFKSVR